MTGFIMICAIAAFILGFALSGILVRSGLQGKNAKIKGFTFLALGPVFSVFLLALTVFIVWPA